MSVQVFVYREGVVMQFLFDFVIVVGLASLGLATLLGVMSVAVRVFDFIGGYNADE